VTDEDKNLTSDESEEVPATDSADSSLESKQSEPEVEASAGEAEAEGESVQPEEVEDEGEAAGGEAEGEVLQNGPMFLEDELDSAYDFESGELIDDDPHAGIPSMNLVSSAKEFFNAEILYRFDILEDLQREKLHGKYQVVLTGDTPETWSVELDRDLEITNKSIEDAEVTFKVSERDFVLLVNGDLNPQLAFLSEKVKTSGSLEKALSFQSILAPTAD